APAAAPAPLAVAAPAAPVAAAAAAAAALQSPSTIITSYGEINVNRPTKRSQEAQADVRRFVLGYQHRFDDKTKVVTELEIEHAISSADDKGEVEVEQAYIERQFTPTWAVRAGLFLIPAGLLNESHEPTAFYGVERNFVETAIIPSTWREGGVQVIGTFDNGLTVQAGLTTSFDLTKWDATSAEGKESPLGSIHQELSLAKSHDVAAFGAINWRGVPGLLLGGSLFTGKASQGQSLASGRITLWDLHARWQPGRWDLSGLYSRGTISNTGALNATLVGNPTLIPKSFDGYYVQGAYKAWSNEDYALSPFARFEQYNTARSYAELGAGLTPDGARNERVVTLGANFQVAQGVVVKADYQFFHANTDLNRVNLGLGWSF
ncbi:MAG: OprO/OprP family phosphate-selective porin, partial [Burkholderiaceae bacterium]|nr:OprO/OprP family phosphate-selective porin [Burkholderiaceae bacterium]